LKLRAPSVSTSTVATDSFPGCNIAVSASGSPPAQLGSMVETDCGPVRSEYIQDDKRLLVRAGVGWAPGTIGQVSLGIDMESPAGYAFHTAQIVISPRPPSVIASRALTIKLSTAASSWVGSTRIGCRANAAAPTQLRLLPTQPCPLPSNATYDLRRQRCKTSLGNRRGEGGPTAHRRYQPSATNSY
jgi:hypothetical protein